jgi:phage repressor protein C with HTH and peptisase S24 domain
METTVKQRLKDYIQFKGLSQKKFETAANLSNGYINNVKTSIGTDVLQKIIGAFPDLDITWLLTGIGSMLTTAAPEITNINTDKPDKNEEITTVPLLPLEAFAGPINCYTSQPVRLSDCSHIVTPFPDAEMAVTISGDSMEPLYHDGSVVYIKRINDRLFIAWGYPYVIDTHNGVFIKQLFPCTSDPDCVELRSLNPAYPPFTVPGEAIYGIYRVLGYSKFNSVV